MLVNISYTQKFDIIRVLLQTCWLSYMNFDVEFNNSVCLGHSTLFKQFSCITLKIEMNKMTIRKIEDFKFYQLSRLKDEINSDHMGYVTSSIGINFYRLINSWKHSTCCIISFVKKLKLLEFQYLIFATWMYR